jgi:DNA-binding NarL/FixJ family response regulator
VSLNHAALPRATTPPSLTETPESRSAVLVDPHPLWLDGVENALNQLGLRVVAKASSLNAATGLLAAAWPSLVVGETTFDGDRETGLLWLESVVAEFPATKIVVLSSCNDEAHISATLSSGAAAYVLKHAHVGDLVATVRQTFTRSVYFPATPPAPPRARTALPVMHLLTRRELDILRLAAEGHSNVRIARILWITEQTVKFHLSNVYRKIGVTNRTEAGRWAQMHGVLDTGAAAPSDQVA